MFTRKDRMKVIKLYLKYDKHFASVYRELGYPKDHRTVKRWYADYKKEQETGKNWERKKHQPKYSQEQKEIAVKYFVEHSRCIARTVRMLGYPSMDTLREWCERS